MERKKAGREDLKYFARTLARQADLSQQTVRSLVESSSTINLTDEEFRGIRGLMNQSRIILSRYGRREVISDMTQFIRSLAVRKWAQYLRQAIYQKINHRTMEIQSNPKKFGQTIKQSKMEELENKVYVQRDEKTNMMTISFEYRFQDKLKQFNLHRKNSELLDECFKRLSLNLDKFIRPKKKDEVSNQKSVNTTSTIKLSIGNICVDPLGIKNEVAWVDGATLQIADQKFQVSLNEPHISFMSLPSTVMTGFLVLPSLNLSNCAADTCSFSWYRMISPQTKDELISDTNNRHLIEFSERCYWLKVGSSLSYSPTSDDVAHYLKVVCEPSDGRKRGLTKSCITSKPVEFGPSFEPIMKRQMMTRIKLPKGDAFRFVSYNILANLYADSEYSRTVLFAHCPPHALEIDYRQQLLLKELAGYNADIICLQEVDKNEYFKIYEPFFKQLLGHSGVFHAKGGQVAEGLATFFDDNRFVKIESHKTKLSTLIDPETTVEAATADDEVKVEQTKVEKVLIAKPDHQNCSDINRTPHPILDDPNSTQARQLLSRFDAIRSKISSNEKLRVRFLGRHTVLQTTLLRMIDKPDTYLIVANTHLYFAPDADHIRLLQGSVCVKYLEFLKEYYKKYVGDDTQSKLNIIFCGDMNSTPDCGLYTLLNTGKVLGDIGDWSSNTDETVEGLTIETRLKFLSAYIDIPYTNYTPLFNGCLDYIYYEPTGLACESTIPLPDHEDVIAKQGIPSQIFPSDHLALIANLKCVDQ